MKDLITYTDFDKLDLRIGTIVAATAPTWSKKLLRFEVDFGQELGMRVIFSGIKAYYPPDFFVGKQFAFIINLAPKKMGDEESQGMMIMADGVSQEGEEKPVVFSLTETVAPGTIVR